MDNSLVYMSGITKYQLYSPLKLLMLFAWKAMKTTNYEDFGLAMYCEKWSLFGDLVFRYEEDDKKYYRCLNSSYCHNNTRIIKISELKSKSSKNTFSLIKYYESYLEIQKRLEADENIKDLIIYTNIGFHFDNFKGDEDAQRWKDFLEERKDPILNVGGKIYKFKKSKIEEVKEELKPILRYIDDSIDKIADFLDKLVFAVEQPSEYELERKIKIEFCNVFNDYTYISFYKFISEWYDGEPNFLTRDVLKRFFDDAKLKVESMIIMVSNTFYELEIEDYGIEFKNEIEELKKIVNFLNNTGKQILMIYQSKTLLPAVKVLHVLKSKQDIKAKYIFIDLKRLTGLRGSSVDLMTIFESFSVNHLIIEHNTTTKEDILRSLFEIVAINPRKKIILITSNEEKADIECIIKGVFNGPSIDIKVTMLEDLSNKLTDLTDESQTSFLTKEGTVIFQGKEVSLGTLIEDNTKPFISGEVLFKVINNEKIEIGQKLEDQKYNEIKEFYVERVLTRYENMNNDIKNEKSMLTMNRLEHDPQTGYEQNEEQLAAKDVVIIVAGPGMGKSTMLSRTALQKNEAEPSLMVLKVNLVTYSSEFKQLMECNEKEELFRLLYKIFLHKDKAYGSRVENNLNSVVINIEDNKLSCTKGEECKLDDVSWFKIQLFNQYYNQGEIFFMFDGVDEISCDCTGVAMRLFKVLKHSKAKMRITTRPNDNIIKELRNELCVPLYTLKPFSEKDQERYFKKCWGVNEGSSNNDVKNFISKHIKLDVVGNPLHIHMIAVVFKDQFQRNNSSEDEELIIDNFESLYAQFVNINILKVDHHYQNPGSNSNFPDMNSDLRFKDLQKLAAYSLLDKSEVRMLLNEQEMEETSEKIEKIRDGEEKYAMIIHVAGNKPVFAHQRYAVFFLCSLIREISATNKEIITHLALETKEFYHDCCLFLKMENAKVKAWKNILTGIFKLTSGGLGLLQYLCPNSQIVAVLKKYFQEFETLAQ